MGVRADVPEEHLVPRQHIVEKAASHLHTAFAHTVETSMSGCDALCSFSQTVPLGLNKMRTPAHTRTMHMHMCTRHGLPYPCFQEKVVEEEGGTANFNRLDDACVHSKHSHGIVP